jgi:hypothetical protein
MNLALSENFIADYVAKCLLPPSGSVFQVIGTKKLKPNGTNLKYRLCLSDGVHSFNQAVLQLADQRSSVPLGTPIDTRRFNTTVQ